MIKDIKDFNPHLQPAPVSPQVPNVVKKVKQKVIEKELSEENEPQQEVAAEEEVDNTEKDEKAILENRIKELEEEKAGKESKKKTKKIRKKFRVPFAFKKLSRKANKNPEYVMVQYLSLKREVSYKVCKIVSGDIIVIGNKVHELNPEAVWKYKKNLFYIIREMDRKPVSNLDWEKVDERKDNTSQDVPLLKAVFGATNKSSGMIKDKNIIIWIVLGALALGAFVIFGGGGA